MILKEKNFFQKLFIVTDLISLAETCKMVFLLYFDNYKNKYSKIKFRITMKNYKCSDMGTSEFLINEMMLKV